MDQGNTDKTPLLSAIVPVYNEEGVLTELHRRLSQALAGIPASVEMLFINDGSADGTLQELQSLRASDPRVCILDLSRNFGKEVAMTAGLDYARGDAVVILDADLQDPPELIPELFAQWQNGFDVVYARRVERKGESWLKRATAYMFYRFMRRFTNVALPEDTGDFRLLSRRAVESLKELREQHRFMKGLFAWIGYPQKAVPFERDPRFTGYSKWNYPRLWNFAIEGITSFTIAPLKISTYLGLLTAFSALIYALVVIIKTLLFGDPVKGYPSLMVVILFLGGMQLFSLGVIGEYLGRMFNETKQRPLYIVQDYAPCELIPGKLDAPGQKPEEPERQP
ncbi:MAG: glycosyltransferase family 2 protein [Desulfobulbaceae bacterium]|nr:glycosyltransferase family 2 protein [Desulfobulbaceae bacterium]